MRSFTSALLNDFFLHWESMCTEKSVRVEDLHVLCISKDAQEVRKFAESAERMFFSFVKRLGLRHATETCLEDDVHLELHVFRVKLKRAPGCVRVCDCVCVFVCGETLPVCEDLLKVWMADSSSSSLIHKNQFYPTVKSEMLLNLGHSYCGSVTATRHRAMPSCSSSADARQRFGFSL